MPSVADGKEVDAEEEGRHLQPQPDASRGAIGKERERQAHEGRRRRVQADVADHVGLARGQIACGQLGSGQRVGILAFQQCSREQVILSEIVRVDRGRTETVDPVDREQDAGGCHCPVQGWRKPGDHVTAGHDGVAS